MSHQRLKFRYPNFGVVRNTIIVFIVIYVISGFIFKDEVFNLEVGKAFAFACAGLCLLELIILHIVWQRLIFDKGKKQLIVKKYILFSPFRTFIIPFKKVAVTLRKAYMYSGRGGLGSGWVWWLCVDDYCGKKFSIASSPFKGILAKKQKEIEDFISL